MLNRLSRTVSLTISVDLAPLWSVYGSSAYSVSTGPGGLTVTYTSSSAAPAGDNGGVSSIFSFDGNHTLIVTQDTGLPGINSNVFVNSGPYVHQGPDTEVLLVRGIRAPVRSSNEWVSF
jgi:hypothetical protein